MNYQELKEKQEKEFNNLPVFFAFNNKQFTVGMGKIGAVDTCEIYSIGGGGFIKKSDSGLLSSLLTKHCEEMEAAMGVQGFMVDAIEYELSNHEYCITYDSQTVEEILSIDMGNPVHAECFSIARKKYLRGCKQ